MKSGYLRSAVRPGQIQPSQGPQRMRQASAGGGSSQVAPELQRLVGLLVGLEQGSAVGDVVDPSLLHAQLSRQTLPERNDFPRQAQEGLRRWGLVGEIILSRGFCKTNSTEGFHEMMGMRRGWSKGPFTHSMFDPFSEAIPCIKPALPYPARMLFFFAKHRVDWKESYHKELKVLLFPISPNLTVFCRSVTWLNSSAG